ncbi:TetR/AcrR family transcriptional regulator [Streptomyces sp. WI04-05B]|uniref:TetR/AcrR family transcriptional regulator n=1 Tax=Streptomyces TaxID=1883 RepID=UPI0029A0A626|nr:MULTISPECIES: TetR/AcrR family transcriptional regulator [unclassified Streptomyces]MDX2547748.1 TetR/AcrR family transcriptional regulator [Streptomyces sp. WI04-05B]MDX2590061.1 TetR/AcrR family transcriptional regulator [Streptomyces sp. WI04-05A]
MNKVAVADGLRERGKAKRRAAVTRAAFQLFAEQGYDATTVAEIAAAAEVSPRTVTLYFRSKQDIAFANFDTAVQRLTARLGNRRPGESAVQALEGWLREEMADHGEVDALEMCMFEANPELRAVRTARMAGVIQEGARIIAEDLGQAPDGIGPRLAAAAGAAVLTEIFEHPKEADRDQVISTAMAFLTGGIEAMIANTLR